jgi:hypothetical protein
VSRLFKPVRWLFSGIGALCRILPLAWATPAIYYSNLPWAWARIVLALAFLAFGLWALWLDRRPRSKWAFAVLFFGIVVWWISIRPSHYRPWRPEVAVMPRAFVDGDHVRIMGVRDFDYRSTDDFTVRYQERDVSISRLAGVDFFLSYWAVGPVAHTFLSFDFEDARPVCISIETRPEVGEGFSPIASLFKQFELIYVVGDERDLVGVRTNFRHEEVYLYHIRMSPENARELFLIYLNRMNELADHPEFYHLLSNSCTVNIIRYARKAGKTVGFDLRYLLNGFVDRYLYSIGSVDTTLPFAALRWRSRINDAARAADDAPDFSWRIRAYLPTPRP